MDTFITQLIFHQKQASSSEMVQIFAHIAAAPFADDLLEIDEPLWGGFWQGDVLAPGYRLPAVELALLRAVRLDRTWPEGTTVAEFLADLRRAIGHPQAGIWTLTVAREPCVMLASPQSTQRSKVVDADMLTVAWYCASTGRLHAGYRATMGTVHLTGAIEQRGFELEDNLKPSAGAEPDWIDQVVKQKTTGDQHKVAAQLDLEILRLRIQE